VELRRIDLLLPDDFRALGEFLATSPLYTKAAFPGAMFGKQPLKEVFPSELRRHCEECDFEQPWSGHAVMPEKKTAPTEERESATVTYRCGACGSRFEVLVFWCYRYLAEERADASGDGTVWGEFQFQKVGQYPPLQARIPPELAKVLGAHADFYRKALTSRHQGYGIGALAYFRRIVEETMDTMLGLLADALREAPATPEIIARVEAAKVDRVFEKKVRVAADALPDSLRPGGFNPFGELHDLYSKGLHGLSDEECVEIVDVMQQHVEIIFTMLKTQVDQRKSYQEAARRFQQAKQGKSG
jgi:hypothetical protein